MGTEVLIQHQRLAERGRRRVKGGVPDEVELEPFEECSSQPSGAVGRAVLCGAAGRNVGELHRIADHQHPLGAVQHRQHGGYRALRSFVDDHQVEPCLIEWKASGRMCGDSPGPQLKPHRVERAPRAGAL
jgi:hypothetical protein